MLGTVGKNLPLMTICYREAKLLIKGLVAALQERDNNSLDYVSSEDVSEWIM